MSLLKKLLLPTLVVLFPAISLAGQPSFEAMARKKPATEERNCESRLLVRLLLVGSETSAPG